MSHRVAANLQIAGPAGLAPKPVLTARPPGERRPMSFLVGPHPPAMAEVAAALHEALPGCECLVFPNGAKAVEKAETARQLGWTPAIFVFNFRGGRAGELAEGLRKVRAAEPNAELVVLLEERDPTLWRAALQVVQTPDKLTFLMTPFFRPDAVSALRSLVE